MRAQVSPFRPSPDAAMLRFDRHETSDQRDRPDNSEPRLCHEPTDNTDMADPIEPTDSTLPTEPIDRTDPTDPTDNSEDLDFRDHRERSRCLPGLSLFICRC